MRTTNKNKLLILLAFVMVFAMLVCAMSIPSFAEGGSNEGGSNEGGSNEGGSTEGGDTDHDHDHEEEENSNSGSSTTKKESWFDSTTGKIVGYSIAGVLFVAMVIFIIWWIPKEKDKKGKKA